MSNMQAEAAAVAAAIKQHVEAAAENIRASVNKKVTEEVSQALKSLFANEIAPEIKKMISEIEVRDGRDGIDVEILPTIDFSKSYPRGVYAMHKGGLWKSYQKTDGQKGWDCIVCGIENIEIKSHIEGDARKFEILIDTSLEQVKKFFTLPVPIYKGVYDPKLKYDSGDMVTFGGCLHHANTEAPEGRPGESKDWTLAAKKGRDGKDFVKLGAKNG